MTPDWYEIIGDLWDSQKHTIFQGIDQDLEKYDYQLTYYPNKNDILNAFKLCTFKNMKVVILGMDPYINEGEAHGLAFSVLEGKKMPPSLRNIFKELHRSYGVMRTKTDLTDWASQGVLLLNTALTVRQGSSGSHTNIWKYFTTEVVKRIGKLKGIVFMLWGNHAQSFEHFIDTNNNLVIKHTHPSPLSRKPFLGNNHFILCNEYLLQHGKEEITWVS
jgi:uracil-DNA glycosylase